MTDTPASHTSTTAQHTPGQWRYELPSVHRPSRVGVSAMNGQVDIYDAPLTTETEANARLIAAAPELLAACQKAYELVGRPLSMNAAMGLSAMLRDAITKAKGHAS